MMSPDRQVFLYTICLGYHVICSRVYPETVGALAIDTVISSLSQCCPSLFIIYLPQKQSVFVLWLTYKIQLPHQSPGWAADAGSIKHFSYSQKFKRIIEDLTASQSQEKNFRWWNRALLSTRTLDKKHWKVDLTWLSWREHMLLF